MLVLAILNNGIRRTRKSQCYTTSHKNVSTFSWVEWNEQIRKGLTTHFKENTPVKKLIEYLNKNRSTNENFIYNCNLPQLIQSCFMKVCPKPTRCFVYVALVYCYLWPIYHFQLVLVYYFSKTSVKPIVELFNTNYILCSFTRQWKNFT